MRARTKKKRRISSAVAPREVGGVVPRDQGSGRSHLLPEAGSAEPREAVAQELAGGLAAFFRGQPADRVPAALLPVRLGPPLEARHPPLVAGDQGPAQARPPGPPVAAEPRKRQLRAFRDPRALVSRGERNPARPRPNRALEAGKPVERRRAPRRAPRRALESPAGEAGRKRVRLGGAPVLAQRAGLSPVRGLAEAGSALVRGAVPGDRFFCPRAQFPRRGYSQVAALFFSTDLS